MNSGESDGLPRLIALIGSGEMAPGMTRFHRALIRRLSGNHGRPGDVRAAIVDTPYGFQANADDLSATALDYFGRRLGLDAVVASYRHTDDVVAREAALDRIRTAAFVFSGPGSPSYALRHWAGTEFTGVLSEKVTGGGALVVASAAALTMGRLTVPVYEIYKVGEEPSWLPGIDVLAAAGIAAAVIPHWDNTEGGGHDTRFCFLGERRLHQLEEQLPDDVLVLGIDEHTLLTLDLDAERATIAGRGTVTIRRHGRDVVHSTGEDFDLGELRDASRATTHRQPAAAPSEGDHEVRDLARRVLDLEDAAGELARRSDLVEPLVEALLDLRSEARSAGDYARADAIRDRLAQLGVEVADAEDGLTHFRLV